MTVRLYTSRSQQTTLTSAVTSGGTTINVANASILFATVSAASITGGATFTVVLDPDTALEEIVEVTGASSNTLTITRSIDAVGTATDHSAGAVVRHMVIGRDLREANTHIEATGQVHGLLATSGVVVGTAATQTLTNKTLTTPTIAGATISGTITSTATISGGTLTGAIVTGLTSSGMADSQATPKNYVDSILGSATAASTSATSAANSATASASSALAASTSAASASTSQTAAASSANTASAAATSATASASSATTSANSAATSASAASTSASSASASASAASTSANSAAASASAASTSANSASASATAAATSASSAATSAFSAAAATSAAATSASSAATSATSSANSATAASTSANSAATSATSSANSATAATTSANSAATSATSAANSATAAATSATSAATSATSAATTYTNYDQRYLGSKSSAPSVDNQGNALITGATYWNSTTNLMYAWSGSAWQAISTTSSYSAPTLGSTTIASGTTYTNVNGLTINSTTIPTSKTLVATDTTDFVATAGGSTITVSSGTTVPLTIQNNGTGNSFVINDVASDTTPLIVDQDGNIAVGNTLVIDNPAQYKEFAYRHSGVRKAYITYDNTNNLLYINAEASGSAMTFYASNAERMRIDSSGYLSKASLRAPKELWTVSATAATGTIQYDLVTQGVLYYTTNASGNFTLNFRGDSGTTLNSLMNTGDTITASFLTTNSTAYYQSSAVTVDGAAATVKWSGGSAPAAGNASSIDAYSYTIIKTANATFTVLCAGPVKYA